MTDTRKVLKNEDIEKVSGGGLIPENWKPRIPLDPIIFENDFPKDPANETTLDYIKRKAKNRDC